MAKNPDENRTRSVKDSSEPKSFSPHLSDPEAPNAWDRLRNLSDRPLGADVLVEQMYALARSSIVARRLRGKHLPDGMFAEPAWEMLLALYVSFRSEARQTVSRLSAASGAPATTALRWIVYLEEQKLVQRMPNPLDKREVFIELTVAGRDAIEAYLADLLDKGMLKPMRS